MSSFTTPLVVEPLDDGIRWKLVEDFDYNTTIVGKETIICVPIGFVTDFASIPRLFWDLLPPWGKYGKAAVLHDYLYSIQVYSRLQSDRILLEAMKVLGVSWLTRWTIFTGVRVGGWLAWNGHKEGLHSS